VKIAVSSVAPDLDAEVEPRFGRSRYFVLVDSATMQFESLENAGSMASGGAGISTAQMIANKGASVVLTGNCGPNAYRTLSAAEVQVISGVGGTVRGAVEDYKSGKFEASTQANVDSHFGMGAGKGMNRGMVPQVSPLSRPASLEQEIAVLESQAQTLARRLSELRLRATQIKKERGE
jgi:predicted Fe-Mo cluster-binding NifX family protein